LGATAAPTSNPQTYPLDTCIVSGEVLGADGDDVITREYDGREVRFCCKKCVKDFEQKQASYLQQLDQAIIQAQLPAYPLQTCIVSGEALGGMGDPVNYVVGNRLVRFCCKGCKKDLDADPAKYLATLDAAVAEAQLSDYPADTCPISGRKLGGMGDPYNYIYAGRLVRFCCAGCTDAFDEDPQAAIATVYDAKRSKPASKHDHSGHNH
jgi:YHS domain-containing protein